MWKQSACVYPLRTMQKKGCLLFRLQWAFLIIIILFSSAYPQQNIRFRDLHPSLQRYLRDLSQAISDSFSTTIETNRLINDTTTARIDPIEEQLDGDPDDEIGSLGNVGLYDYIKRLIERDYPIYLGTRNQTNGLYTGLDSLYEDNGRLIFRFRSKRYVMTEVPDDITQHSLKIRSADSEQLFREDPEAWDIDQDVMIYVRFSNQVDSTTHKWILRKRQSTSVEWNLTLLANEAIQMSIEHATEPTSIFQSGAASVGLGGYYGRPTWHSIFFTYDTSNAGNCKIYWDGDSLALVTRTHYNNVDYSNTGNFIVGANNQNFDISKLAIWKLGDGNIDRLNLDDLAKYLHNNNYDNLDFNSPGIVYPQWCVDSLKAYYIFNEDAGQFVYSFTSDDTLILGTTRNAEAADPEWQSYAPDNPNPIVEARPDSSYIMHIDYSEWQSGWRQKSLVNIVPMRRTHIDGNGDEIYLQRRSRPELLVLDNDPPNDSLLVRFHNIPDGLWSTFRTNVMELWRSYDGGYTWDSLKCTMIDGSRELSSSLDSIRVMRNQIFITEGDTLINIAGTIKNTGSGSTDWLPHKTYAMFSTDYGETWTDTLAIWDSVFHCYAIPSMVQNGDTLHISGFSYEGNTQSGGISGDPLPGVLHWNFKTNETTHNFLNKNDRAFRSEFSMIMYDTANTKIVGLVNRDSPTRGWWVGYSTDYGVTWTDSSSHYPDNKYPNPPRLFMMKNPDTGLDSLIWQVHTNKLYYLDSVQTKISTGDPFTVQGGVGINMIWAAAYNKIDRISPNDSSEVADMICGGSPSFIQYDANNIIYGVSIEGSNHAEPYIVHITKVLDNADDRKYEDPRYNGYFAFPGNADGSPLMTIAWVGTTTAQDVEILFPPAGVSASILSNNTITFDMGDYGEGTPVKFRIK